MKCDRCNQIMSNDLDKAIKFLSRRVEGYVPDLAKECGVEVSTMMDALGYVGKDEKTKELLVRFDTDMWIEIERFNY